MLWLTSSLSSAGLTRRGNRGVTFAVHQHQNNALKWPLSSPERASSSYSECLLINNHPGLSQDCRELEASSICSLQKRRKRLRKWDWIWNFILIPWTNLWKIVVLYHLQCKSPQWLNLALLFRSWGILGKSLNLSELTLSFTKWNINIPTPQHYCQKWEYVYFKAL